MATKLIYTQIHWFQFVKVQPYWPSTQFRNLVQICICNRLGSVIYSAHLVCKCACTQGMATWAHTCTHLTLLVDWNPGILVIGINRTWPHWTWCARSMHCAHVWGWHCGEGTSNKMSVTHTNIQQWLWNTIDQRYSWWLTALLDTLIFRCLIFFM